MIGWCTRLPDDMQIQIESITDRDSVGYLLNYVSELDLDIVINSKTGAILPILNVFGNQVKNNISYANDKDPTLTSLLQRLAPAYKLYKSMMGTTS
ncbi:MAG: hypothetical protein WCB31_08510 [Nitrososphaeraceae archaeon]